MLASYSHAMIVYGYGVFACWNEPKMWTIMGSNLKTCHEVMRPDAYMMVHDELRHMGWDAACRKTGKTCGLMLADNVKRCISMIRQEDPGKPIYAWSDMFDPTTTPRTRASTTSSAARRPLSALGKGWTRT